MTRSQPGPSVEGSTFSCSRKSDIPRLDWLYLKQLTALDYGVDTVPLTDHRGVWTRMGFD